MMENTATSPEQPTGTFNWDKLGEYIASVSEQMKETDRRMERRMQETDRQMKESIASVSEQMQETDRRMERRMQETDRQMKEAIASVSEQMKETDRRMQETDRQMKETDRQMKETDMQIKKLSEEVQKMMKRRSLLDNEWGRFLEEMCIPSCIEIFKREGIGITQRYSDITHAKDDEGHEMEVDAILCNTTEAVVIEVKANCCKKDVDHFLKQLRIFKKVFHPFDRCKVYAAIVGVKFQRGVKEYARKMGLYVIDCPAEGIFSLAMKPSPEQRLCL